MTDLSKLVKTVRRIAGEYSMLERPETKKELIEVADYLELLIGTDPKVVSHAPASTSKEVVGVATKGPGPPLQSIPIANQNFIIQYDPRCPVSVDVCICGHDILRHTIDAPMDVMGCAYCTCPEFKLAKKAVKMTANPEENERVPMSRAKPIQVILRSEDSPYDFGDSNDQ